MMETSIATRSNTEIIQKSFADFSEGNISAVINTCADDTVWSGYKIPGVDITGTFHGKEGVQQFFTMQDEQIVITNLEAKEFIAQGDYVIVLGHETGTVKKTGKSYDQDWAMSFKLRDGKVQECFQYYDSYNYGKAFS